MAKLSAIKKRFCDEYLIDLNATQAVIRAGYKINGDNSAASIGSKLLKDSAVAKEIAKQMAERSKRTGINQDRVVQELARIAFVRATDVIETEDASVKEYASEDDLACIQSIKVKTVNSDKATTVEREVKLNDKMKALELLGKHLGMFIDKIQVDNPAEEMKAEKLDNIASILIQMQPPKEGD